MQRCTTSSRVPAVAALVLLLALPELGACQSPLLQPGKQSIFQRVLTRPGAELAENPGDTQRRLVNAFSRFYVYARQDHGGERWLQLGTDTRGREMQGWIAEDQTVPWKQQLTLAFTNPGAQRDRLLFFRSRDDLNRILGAPEPGQIAAPLTEKVVGGGTDERVVAVEPENFVDINEQFYLLPILDHEVTAASTGDRVRALKVASVSKQQLPAPSSSPSSGTPAAPTTGSPAAAPQTAPEDASFTALRSFSAAVVFVIDSTISMKRYIAETKAAVARVYERMKDAEVLDLASFGLVAYRAASADPNRTRRLEYVARKFVDPYEVRDGEGFLARVRSLSEAPVTTDRFEEDAYAGVMEALEEIRWSEFGARYIVLISDAGALDGEASTTGMDAERLRSLASEQGIAIYVLHLKTPAGRSDHAQAREQYLELSENAAVQEPLYFPVAADSGNRLGQTIDTLSESIIDNIRLASQGSSAAGSVLTATALGDAPSSTSAPASTPSTPAGDPGTEADAELERLRAITNALGHAMELAYLGKVEKTLAPTLFEAWICDRDFKDPAKRMVDVRVLLTKNQLSDLQMMLEQVIHAAETGMLAPDRFFESLRSLAVQFGRDPNLARRPEATRLADLGLLGEYLEDLPYQSDVMGIDQDTWTHWGPQRQLAFTNRLKAKVRLYERYNADWRRWINLAQTSAAGPGEWVYPVPLLDLP